MDSQLVEDIIWGTIVMELIIKIMNIDEMIQEDKESEWHGKPWERGIGNHDDNRKRIMPWKPKESINRTIPAEIDRKDNLWWTCSVQPRKANLILLLKISECDSPY